MKEKFWLSDKRFYIIATILMLMWLGLMLFFYLKADEVTKHPCSICAEKIGEEVRCTTGGYKPITKVFHPNFSIEYDKSSLLQ